MKVEADPTNSMRTLAKVSGVDPKTIRIAVKDDLGFTSYVRRRRQLLSNATKANRVEKRVPLLTRLKRDRSTVRIFSDKQLWTVDQARDRQNDRFLAYNVEQVPPINATKLPASAVMIGVVTSDGKKMPPSGSFKGSRQAPRST